jgi:site-specific DNA-methyltransferase (adenine-specific)
MDIRPNSLYNMNCLEGMKFIPDGSIDMVLCDLPYGTTKCSWDILIPFEQLWEQYNRIVKNSGAILLFGQEPFSSFVRLSNLQDYKYDWYWQKERLTNVFQVKRRPGKVIETISVFYKEQCFYNPQKTNYTGPERKNKIGEDARWSVTMAGRNPKTKPLEYKDDGTRYPLQIIQMKRDSNRDALHPTQKPVALFEYLIKTYTNEGEIVLDNCMGSGTTAIACINTNRNFIGFELDTTYCGIADSRIQDVLSKRR